MRILLTVDAVGGVWQYGLDLACALAARGVEPVLALLGPADDAHLAEARALSDVTLVETGLPLDWLCDGPAPVLAAGEAIARLAAEVRADIVQLNMPTLAAAARFDVPVVAVAHGCVATWWAAAKAGEPLGEDYRWHRELMAAGLRAADRVVAPSASYAGTVASHYGLPGLPQVVHNGRTPLVSPSTGVPATRALTVGRLWDRVKRADLLDRVAARLSVPFDAAGAVEGPHGERADLRHLNLLGRIDEGALAARLAERPVFVSAASFEPFGLAVLEAASAGCALLLSDIPTFRELWDGAATFVTPDDDAAYAHAVEALMGDGEARERLGQAARERAASYTPAAMADGMLAIYADVRHDHATGTRVAA